jgi:uncharacterized membrane protein
MRLAADRIVRMCPDCEPGRAARDFVLSAAFWRDGWMVLLPFAAMLMLVALVVWRARVTPLGAAGVALGIGLGGFVDGIVLHQLLQWHEMVSGLFPPDDLVAAKVNMLWDGVFHAMTWLACAAGVTLLFRAARRGDVAWSGRHLVGAMIGGWGIFNLAEGVLDHLILGIHHVHPGRHELAWDIGFVSLGGLGLIAVGYALRRMRPSDELPAAPGPMA